MFSDFLVILLNIYWGAVGIEAVFKKQHNLSRKEIDFLRWLFVFHQFMSIVFGIFILKSGGGDAEGYWMSNVFYDAWLPLYKPGTMFMSFLTYPFTKYLGMNFYTGGLMFGMIGFSSFIYLYVIVRKFTPKPIKLYSVAIFPLLLYSPNTNFWSSGIGKDSLVLFAIMLYFYAIFHLKTKWGWALFGLALAYHIRPHMALFLIVSSGAAILLDGKVKANIKVGLFVVMVTGTGLLFNKVLAFMKMDEISSSNIEQFTSDKARYLSKNAGSALDMANYPLPLKVFTFLYRPLFIDTPNALGLVQSCENAVLLWLTLLVLTRNPVKSFKAAPFQLKAMVVFIGISAVGFSMILSNLGIMLREKIPVIMCMMIFIFWNFQYNIDLRKRRLLAKRKRAEAEAALAAKANEEQNI